MQQTPVWCWAASAEALLRHLDFPNVNPGNNYQCGIVGVTFPKCAAGCFGCVQAIGALPNIELVLRGYANYVLVNNGFGRTDFNPTFVANPSFAQIQDALDRGYVVIGGISPAAAPVNPANAQHAIVISGYAAPDPGETGLRAVAAYDPLAYEPGKSPYDYRPGVSYDPSSGRVEAEWGVFLHQLHFTAAVFVNPPGSNFDISD